MGITAEQREQRRNFLGSSDIAAICGFDPFRSPHDVYLEKKYDLEDYAQKTKAIEIGNRMEQALLDYASENAALDVRPNVRYESGIFAANCDGVAREDGQLVVVEAKTTSRSHEWGAEGTDAVPYRVTLQVQHQMLCSGAVRAYVPVLLSVHGRLDIRLYVVERDEDIIDKIRKVGLHFWNAYIEQDLPPPDDPSIAIVQSIVRDSHGGLVVDLEDALCEDYLNAQEGAKRAGEEKERAKARLLAALEDNRFGASEGYEVSYKEQTRKEYTVPAKTYSVLRVRPLKDKEDGSEDRG